MDYCDLIRTARIKAGLTQHQLGKACGYEDSSAGRIVRKWETGACKPTLEVVRRLAAALSIPLDSLIP